MENIRVVKIPYIKAKRKKALGEDSVPQDAGELTYLICRVVDDYLIMKSKETGLRYQYLAEVAGALANSQQEVYRRLTKPYETAKIVENGDMFRAHGLIRENNDRTD